MGVQTEGFLGRETGRAASPPAPAPRGGEGCKQRVVDEGGLVSLAEGSPTRGGRKARERGLELGNKGKVGTGRFETGRTKNGDMQAGWGLGLGVGLGAGAGLGRGGGAWAWAWGRV